MMERFIMVLSGMGGHPMDFLVTAMVGSFCYLYATTRQVESYLQSQCAPKEGIGRAGWGLSLVVHP
jgi:hypothetical protein